MLAPASPPTDSWDIVTYEATMLFDLYRELGSESSSRYPHVVKNALVESTCLHTRILVDILLSKDSHKDDDIRLNQLLPAFRHPSVEKLRDAYGDAKTERSPCWTLNKMVAHPTLNRSNSHDYTDVIKKLLPLIESVLQEIDNHRSVLPKLAKPTGGFDPRFCAKTSS